MELGKKIAYYRKSKNITQDALAKQLGISNQAVSKWETEQSYPDVELLPKIADIFGITLDELFEREAVVQESALTIVEEENPVDSLIPSGNVVSLPWEDDENLRAVLFVGHRMIQKDEVKDKFGGVCKEITVSYRGPVKSIDSCFNVNCGAVGNGVAAGGYVECGDVGCGVTAVGYVECGDVGNGVTAGGYVECGDVGESIMAGGYVECDDVGGNVSAGGNVECDDVSGDVRASGAVECGDVGGCVYGN